MIKTSNAYLLEAAKAYGTPLYYYEMDQIAANIAYLREIKDPRFKINYALKANYNRNIAQFMKKKGLGLDLVSPGELDYALARGFSPNQCYFTPSNPSLLEWDYCIKKGAFPIVDSWDAVRFVKEKYPNKTFGIRIRPNIRDGANEKIQVGTEDSKFGIPLYELNSVLDYIKSNHLSLSLLHAHVGSELGDISSVDKTLSLFSSILQKHPKIESVNIGGGFPSDMQDTSWGKNSLSALLNEFWKQHNINIFIEPGKFLVANAGYLIAEVNQIKPTSDHQLVCLNTGFNQLIRPMYYGSIHPIRVLEASEDQECYSLVGNICEKDVFAEKIMLPKVKNGTKIAIEKAGAYCYAMGSHYNLRFLPKECMRYEGHLYMINEQSTPNSILQTQKSIVE